MLQYCKTGNFWPVSVFYRLINCWRLQLLVTILCGLAVVMASSGASADTKKDALPLASGESLLVEELMEATVVVNFWATWCAPCRSEIPELNELYKDSRRVVSSNGEQNLLVLGVDFDRNKAGELDAAIEEMGIEFPVLTEESALRLQFEWPQVLPVTLIIQNGKVMETLRGQQSRDSLMTRIRLLDE